jgi:fatty acid desaturase
MAWMVIIGMIWWAVVAQNIWVSILAIFIVATRQNLFGLLVHEQAHCLAFRARYGDTLVNLLVAYPLLVLTVEGYAQVHLSHHKFYFTEKDPDFLRKSGEEWTFPMRASKLFLIFLKDLFGLNVWSLIKGKKMSERVPVFKRPHPTPTWIRFAYYAVMAAILTLTGTWMIFLLYWVLPLFTIFQVMVRWGGICEHEYNIKGATVAETSPIIELRWWEKLLFPNLNFTLHSYHHYFPGISFSNLPKVHQIFKREGLVNDSNVFHGYWSYLKFLVQKPASTTGVSD